MNLLRSCYEKILLINTVNYRGYYQFFVDIWKTIANGNTWQGEIKNVSKNGDVYWVKTTIVPNFGDDGKPTQYVGIRTEITKDKLREKELITLSEDLTIARDASERANTTKSEFLAAMSHEIRTPMAGVIGMAELILGQKLEPQVKDWALGIQTSGNHLMKILNEILDQSKLDAGKVTIDPVDFHLVSFIKSITDLFLPKIVTKGLALDVQVDEAIPAGVNADPSRITQILSNFLSNALKFTDTGNISIIVEHEPLESDNFKLRFSILDSGIGLSEVAQAKLFTAFTQADSSTSRTYGGTGLGLSISKQLVELMDGEIGVSSVEGVGSKFWFTIPSCPAKSTVKPIEAHASANTWHASRPLKVLVAEDTDVIQVIIAAILDQLNHKPTIVDNGKKAIEALEAEDFDIILMDIRMPVMDGMEATTIIRSMNGEKSTIPIIALTADVSAKNIKEYRAIGMSAVCSKPIKQPELLKEINSLLDEEIHTSNPRSQPVQQNRQATNTEDRFGPTQIENGSEVSPKDTSFTQVLERVSTIVDQLSEQNEKSSVPSVNIEGISTEKFAEMQAEYEEYLIETCRKLKSAIDDLAENPADDAFRSEVLMLAHIMKGGGSSYNYPLVTAIAGEVDKLLKAEASLAAEHFDILGNHLNSLSLIAEKKISGDGGKAGDVLLRGLKAFS